MLTTLLCEILGIDVPIILAAIGDTASSGEFAPDISVEGFGSIGSQSVIPVGNPSARRDTVP